MKFGNPWGQVPAHNGQQFQAGLEPAPTETVMGTRKNMKNRQSIRLKYYDHSSHGAYFMTIGTRNREYLFGKIVDGGMVLNELGKLVFTTWHDLPNHNSGIELDEFVIMPNHIHGIVIIVGAGSIVHIGGQGLTVDRLLRSHTLGVKA